MIIKNAFDFSKVFGTFGVLDNSHQFFKDVFMYWNASGLGNLFMYWDQAFHIFMINMIKHINPTRFWSAWVWGVLSVGRQVPGWGGRGGFEEGVERGVQVTMDGDHNDSEEMFNIKTMANWPCSQIWMIIYRCGWWYSFAGSTTRIAWVSSLQVGALIKTLL